MAFFDMGLLLQSPLAAFHFDRVHSHQYQEPSSLLWLGKALSWLITVRLISIKHNMKRISINDCLDCYVNPAGPLSLFRPRAPGGAGCKSLFLLFNRLLSLFLASKFWPHHFRKEERSSPYKLAQ